MISKRVSELSSNEQVFNEARPIYEKALKDSGFNESLTYTGPRVERNNQQRDASNSRKRKIIWYNPPFSKNVKTNIGQKFLGLVDKHFPRGSKLHKKFNRNTIKISYSSMRNVASIISSHNKKILSPNTPSRTCNCPRGNRDNCPLDNRCLTENIVYKARISNNSDEDIKSYVGMTEPIFKKRFYNHTRDANNVGYRNTTELSKYIWSLKDGSKIPNVTYEVLHQVHGKPSIHFCRLCTTEKLVIIENLNDNTFLNKRSEFISKCRHINKFLIDPPKDKNG